MKKLISFITTLFVLFIALESCEEDKEQLSYIELQIDKTEYIFTGGEVDYGNAPFGFFDHLTPHVGNNSHALEIYGGSGNSEHYYEGEYVEIKINTGSYEVESTSYPCSICFCSPDFKYCGEGVASILQYGGTTGYLKVSIDSASLTNTSEVQTTTKKISNVFFTVKLYGDTYSIE